MRVAILGATGAVGREMWRLLEASEFPIEALSAYTSRRSAGATLRFRGADVVCEDLTEAAFRPADLVLASAGAAASRLWSPRFAALGAIVVDNSSAFRSDPACALVVPEVNPDALDAPASIFAVPNCSTIQMVVALAPLHAAWTLAAIRVATYQSVSGAGARAMEELLHGTRKSLAGEPFQPEVFPHDVTFNVLPHIGSFDADGESQEETKMRDETRRLLGVPGLPVSATCVRVPVLRGHSEAVWASFAKAPDPESARRLLRERGVVVEDEPEAARYPLPTRAAGRDEVFVGRVRRDPADPLGLCLWVVSDNLLKGAATNAFQIARHLVARGRVGASRSAR